jgi:hypothetical protein
VVFQKAILRAPNATEVATRVQNLIDCITHSVYLYTTRGLFECDKLIFTAQMAFQVGHLVIMGQAIKCLIFFPLKQERVARPCTILRSLPTCSLLV